MSEVSKPTSKRQRNGVLWFSGMSALMFIACGGAMDEISQDYWNIVFCIVTGLFGFLFMGLAIVGPDDALRQKWVDEERAKLQKRLGELS